METIIFFLELFRSVTYSKKIKILDSNSDVKTKWLYSGVSEAPATALIVSDTVKEK